MMVAHGLGHLAGTPPVAPQGARRGCAHCQQGQGIPCRHEDTHLLHCRRTPRFGVLDGRHRPDHPQAGRSGPSGARIRPRVVCRVAAAARRLRPASAPSGPRTPGRGRPATRLAAERPPGRRAEDTGCLGVCWSAPYWPGATQLLIFSGGRSGQQPCQPAAEPAQGSSRQRRWAPGRADARCRTPAPRR